MLASFEPAELSPAARIAWLQRSVDLGSRRIALVRLSASADLREQVAGLGRALHDCAEERLARLAVGDESKLLELRTAMQVPDDYLPWRRVLGLYPLTAQIAKLGVRGLHDEIHASYTLARDALPVNGELKHYVPAGGTLAFVPPEPPLPATLPEDALGATLPSQDDLQNLFQRHAPILAIDTEGPFDVPGQPFFAADGTPTVIDTSTTVYTYPSLTRFGGQLRLQLNYVWWFDARPRKGPLDTLGGHLDGLVWRVTLDGNAQPIAYDSIHPCGCYHLLFPTDQLQVRREARQWPEPPLVVQRAPPLKAGERIVLRLASETHYLLRAYAVSEALFKDDGVNKGHDYRFEPYASLYRVPSADGARSLFDSNGIVPGTERAESLYLWPMGIRAPGAMRERGRQATAFIGRRHFDDAFVLERIFALD
ncbi:MAG: hypothetical protein Cons2KO_11820 [Congregibacter sp.]